MSYLFIKPTVKDYAAWKPLFDGHAAFRKAAGSKGARLFRSSENPNEIALLFEWDDPKRARQFVQSPELREAMERSGVIGRPDVYFLDEIERISS
jgi:heme-degrading monooxygenase HmoA